MTCKMNDRPRLENLTDELSAIKDCRSKAACKLACRKAEVTEAHASVLSGSVGLLCNFDR